MSISQIYIYNANMNNPKAKEQIKSMVALSGITLSELAEQMTQKTGKNYSLSSLSQKLSRGSIPYNEVMLIADLLGFRVTYEYNK